jgi:glyoxylase-like metal-dependent hydrolase (beta-lactamase superfamily II)
VEVAPGIWRLGSAYVNWYVIDAGGKLTVLDAALPGYYGQFLDLLAALGRPPSDVEAVLLTHGHSDHTGSADAVRTAAGCRVLIHEADRPLAARGGSRPKRLPLHRPAMVKAGLHMARNGGLRKSPVAGLESFQDGEVLDVPGKPRIIHAPGHTPGSCAVWLQDRDVLFSGDVLVTLNIATGATGPMVPSAGFNWDQPQAAASLDVIASLQADRILPGHGEPWNGPVSEAVRLARAAARS